MHLANTNQMEDISSLLEQSQAARKSNNWEVLEEISIRILQTLFKGSSLKDETLKQVVVNYLSSIVGTGDFLTNLSSKNSDKYKQGLDKLNDFLEKKPHLFNSIDPIIQSGREIALLVLEPTSQNKNKISKNLRVIARPDLAVIICMQILEVTRLNYYSLTVLCGAYCDLGYFDKAIEAAEKALKHDPGLGKSFVLNSLVRAHTLKFKSNGDFLEITNALEYAHQSIDLKLDIYSANAYMAAAVASMINYEIENATTVLAKAEPDLKVADINAIIQSAKAVQALSPNSVGIEIIDELDDDGFFGDFDSLLDLVIRDEGFKPEVEDVRQMVPRFKSGGWFLQGICNVPCPKCEKISLHSYRKHFGRYGKEMHYWGLVCDVCKTATDSKDFEKRYFTFISTDLEKNYPVEELCGQCNPSQVLEDQI
jgi:tetratricopeptide (TPR) repeat protein